LDALTSPPVTGDVHYLVTSLGVTPSDPEDVASAFAEVVAGYRTYLVVNLRVADPGYIQRHPGTSCTLQVRLFPHLHTIWIKGSKRTFTACTQLVQEGTVVGPRFFVPCSIWVDAQGGATVGAVNLPHAVTQTA
jgi:hypothetical protein